MYAKENSVSGDDNFEEKKAVYKSSSFIITSKIDSLKDWDKATLQKRQEEMAKMAAKIWSAD